MNDFRRATQSQGSRSASRGLGARGGEACRRAGTVHILETSSDGPLMATSKTPYQHNRHQQLRGFCLAAQTGSISRAAEKLYLSQPSVSLQIKALERELGVELFERRGPRISLTRDGRMLLELARPLIEEMEQLPERFANQRQSGTRGTVRVAAGGSTLQFILPPYIRRFVKQFPDVDVRLHNVTGKDGLAQLRAGDIDCAVGPMLEAPPDIVFHPLFTFEPMLITCRDHPLARKRRVTLREISRFPLILPPRNQSTYRVVERVFSDHALEYDVKLEVGGYEVIKTYVQLGLGISIVMSHCLTKRDALHAISVKRYFPKRSYGVVLRQGQTISPAAERFIEVLSAGTHKP